jgi:crotonobetainyl-CoA:carnitine CoA-transferase CaiB-like acyl-CoA transferase
MNDKRCEEHTNKALEGYRALDLTDEKGYLCGKILGDLGADVIKVEKPEGDPGRHLGPFYKDTDDPEKNLLWFAHNTSKRSITLDITSEEGRNIFLALAKKTDIVVESFQPGRVAELGLGYDDLSKINPGIILVSISGFGQSGPFAKYKAPDIVVMATSGYMNLVGNPKRPPVRITVPQAYLHGASEGAVGCLIALWHREMTGAGQHVDASAQQAVAWNEFHNQNFWDMRGINLSRLGGERMYGKVNYRMIFACKDGHIIFGMYGGPIAAKRQRALVAWMDEAGMADPFLRDFDWENWSPLTFNTETARELEARFDSFFLTKTKKELFAAALTKGFLIAPINAIRDLAQDPHFAERNFWQVVEHSELGEAIPYAGAPYKSKETPYRIRKRAPLIGEDNDDVFRQELGFSGDKMAELKNRGII